MTHIEGIREQPTFTKGNFFRFCDSHRELGLVFEAIEEAGGGGGVYHFTRADHSPGDAKRHSFVTRANQLSQVFAPCSDVYIREELLLGLLGQALRVPLDSSIFETFSLNPFPNPYDEEQIELKSASGSKTWEVTRLLDGRYRLQEEGFVPERSSSIPTLEGKDLPNINAHRAVYLGSPLLFKIKMGRISGLEWINGEGIHEHRQAVHQKVDAVFKEKELEETCAFIETCLQDSVLNLRLNALKGHLQNFARVYPSLAATDLGRRSLERVRDWYARLQARDSQLTRNAAALFEHCLTGVALKQPAAPSTWSAWVVGVLRSF